MRTPRAAPIGLLLLIAVAIPHFGSAQYALSQGRTLQGLDRVYVSFADPNEEMNARDLEQLYTPATLELRKVGIRVTRDPDELDMGSDGVLNISLLVYTGFSDSVTLRIDVEQRATLLRTGETLQMVTWFYESTQTQPRWRDFARSQLMTGINSLLSDWLEANGR